MTRRIALLSVAVAVMLILMKIWAWAASGSVGMLSSLADSTLDLAASLFTLFAVRYAAAPPDREHRFGHGKAEAFAGLFQAGLVAVSAALILVEAVRSILSPREIAYARESIVVMVLSIALTGLLVYAQSRAIRQTGSLATQGDRVHYFSDLASNLAVIVGLVAAAYWNIPWADSAAGIFVTLWLVLGAWDIARRAADHLMDREAPDEVRARVQELALVDPALRAVHDLRTRLSGPYMHVQFHADLDPEISLAAAHAIIVAAEQRIRAEFPSADIIIHPDPGARAEKHGLEHFGEAGGV